MAADQPFTATRHWRDSCKWAMATVALLHATPRLIDGLRDACTAAGLLVCAVHIHDLDAERLDPDTFIRQHDPAVVVVDLVPPYPDALERLRAVSRLASVRGRQLVVTAPDPDVVAHSLDHDGRVFDVVGQHDDLAPLMHAIKEATRARPSR